MRSLVKKLRSWCDNWLAKDETNSQYIGVMNEMHANRGAILAAVDAAVAQIGERIDKEMSAYWVSNGPTLVRQVVENMAEKLSDSTVVLRDIVEDNRRRTEDFLGRREGLLNNSVAHVERLARDGDKRSIGYHQQILAAFDRFENKSMRRTTATHQAFAEMAKRVTDHANLHDYNNAERHLALLERVRELDAQMTSQFCTSDRHVDHVYEALQEQINSLEKAVGDLATAMRPRKAAKVQGEPQPTLEWLMDNLDEMIEMAKAAEALKYNDAPREMTLPKLVHRIRNLHLYGVCDVRDEVEGWLSKHDNDVCQAA